MADVQTATRNRARGAAPPQGEVVYLDLHRASPEDRISMIKRGLPAREAKRILADLSISQAASFEALNLSVATVNKKAARAQSLSAAESERVLGVARLRGQLEAMLAESSDGAPGFDAADWLSTWLGDPLPALGGRRPLDLLDTMEGQALVSDSLARMQSGAYA